MLNHKFVYGENRINYDVKGYRIKVCPVSNMVWEDGEPVFHDVPGKFLISLRYRDMFVSVWSMEFSMDFERVHKIADRIVNFATRCSIRHPKKLMKCLSKEEIELMMCTDYTEED